MKSDTVIDFSSVRTGCHNCGLAQICQLAGNVGVDNEEFERMIKRGRKVERGENIFRVNEAFTKVYAIRSGSVKTYASIEDGKEQVTGFHLPGELLGLASISTNVHTESAIALETCSICEIPFNHLENLSKTHPVMQHALLHAMSEEIQYDHHQLTLISRMSAEARLASFLISVSGHFEQRGFSATDFNISMTRSDIANLLGLAVETVSRIFSQFQDKGLLSVERRHIVLRNPEGLKKLSAKYPCYTRPGYLLHNQAS